MNIVINTNYTATYIATQLIPIYVAEEDASYKDIDDEDNLRIKASMQKKYLDIPYFWIFPVRALFKSRHASIRNNPTSYTFTHFFFSAGIKYFSSYVYKFKTRRDGKEL